MALGLRVMCGRSAVDGSGVGSGELRVLVEKEREGRKVAGCWQGPGQAGEGEGKPTGRCVLLTTNCVKQGPRQATMRYGGKRGEKVNARGLLGPAAHSSQLAPRCAVLRR
jgi:hypothetical protein